MLHWKLGGLGMSSFLALNRALLFKRVWRFRVQPDPFWAKVVNTIHENHVIFIVF